MTIISKKQFWVQDIQNNFHDSKAVIFYNFHQLENRKISQLKKELIKVGGQWKVYKNSLVEKVLTNYSLELKHANAFVFCNDDKYKPLSILAHFNKQNSEIKRFQGGIYEQKLVSNILIEKWANLPSKEVLISTLCYYLNYQTQRLINVLEKLKDSKI